MAQFLKYIGALLFLVMSFPEVVKVMEMPEYDIPPEAEREDYPDYGGMRGRGRGRYGRRGYHHVEARNNEAIVGDKRFKLYEKKRLIFFKARRFCKDRKGELVNLKSIGMEEMDDQEESKGLQKIFARAAELRVNIWTALDDKEWKDLLQKEAKHMKKLTGRKALCPALSLGRGGVIPVSCRTTLPYICKYKRDRPRTTKRPKGDVSTARAPGKKKGKKRRRTRDEMK